MAFRNDGDQKAYWKENLGLLAKLLVVWFVVSFGAGILFVDALNNIQFTYLSRLSLFIWQR